MAKTTSQQPQSGRKSPVLYRKYRPTRLEDVVGQEQITSVLSNALKQGKIAHAYLFIGPRGTGKTSVARIFAHAVNGFDYQVEDNYLDIIEIDAASNTGVDNIRELREKAIIAPTTGKYKVYIIDEVHMLTKSASNALLKTLEEPPEHVIFIMATTDAYKVPITISSRTQVHTFKLAAPEVMQAHLRKIADAEGIKISDEALEIVVRRGGGSFRDSLSLLDQISSLSTEEITATALNQALGLPQAETIAQLLQTYTTHDVTKIHTLLQDLLDSGLKPETIASELISNIVKSPDLPLLPLLAELPKVAAPFPEAKLLLAFLGATGNNNAPSSNFRPIKTDLSPQATTRATPVTPVAPPEAPSESTPSSHPTPGQEPVRTPPVRPEKPSASNQPPKSFDWETFAATIQEANDAVYSQLLKTTHEYIDGVLHLYPEKPFTKNILERPGNRQILSSALAGAELMIHQPDERPLPKDSQISQISAIMGKVQEVGDDAPF